MRVGMISPYSFTLPGGVQMQALYLARALRRRGVSVSLLGPCDGPPPEPDIIPIGNSLFIAANGSFAPIAFDIPAFQRSYAVLRDQRFDLLHVHEPLVPAPSLAALVSKRAPLVATFHAAGGSAAYDNVSPVLRWVCNRLDWRGAVSSDAAEMARRCLGGTYEVLFNGVPVERFRQVKPHPTEGPTIFFVGRHEPRKGLAVLLAAMRGLPADVVLWIAGEGPQTELLKRRMATDQRVRWLGRLSEEEKISRLRGADVFCAPSLRGESFGVVLLEAMAAETPIVASDIPGYARVARPGIEATLVPPGDTERLAEALRQTLLTPGDLVARGIERAEQFSMDRLAERYEDVYRRVLA
ncbi:MAG: glycosyltransferase family 4 protein [Acidimicrobiia bacterium]|nr:glycosyltransferase family 4 protein [Acidimicrobiia bacterium]